MTDAKAKPFPGHYAALADSKHAASALDPARELHGMFGDHAHGYFGKEARRLQDIKEELWKHFHNGQAHLPNPVVPFANAYNDTLTLQLRVIGMRRAPVSKPSSRPAPGPRDDKS